MVSAGDSIFASRSFRQYYFGQAFSYLGDGLRLLAIPLLVFYLTHKALGVGIGLILEIAPFALLGPVAGAFADRVDRRRLMIACDFIRFCVLATFAITFLMHTMTLTLLYSGLIVLSISAAFFMSGQAPSIPYLLGKGRTTEAMSVLISTESATNMIGPVVGGALFSIIGPLPALVMNAFTYGVSQISLSMVPTLGPDVQGGRPSLRELLEEIGDGFRYTLKDAGMRAMTLMSFFLNVFGFGCYAILVPYLKQVYGSSDQQIGFFYGIAAIGMICGSLLAGRLGNRWTFGRMMTVVFFIDAFVFIPFNFAPNMYLAAANWAITSACAGFEVTQIIGWRLRITPENLTGRVTGVVRLVALVGSVPGILLLSWMDDHYGPHLPMLVGTFGFLIIALIGISFRAIRDEAR